MNTRTISWAISLVISSVILSGCDAAAYLLARAGMVLVAMTNARPDRTVTFDITVTTTDKAVLNFKGKTECRHSVTANGAGYSTNSHEARIVNADTEWILSGINCNSIIRDQQSRDYRLYRRVSDNHAKIYFVADNGPARITNASYDSKIGISSQLQAPRHSAYSAGPYIYVKFLINNRPPIEELTRPTVVYAGSTTCGRHNRYGKSYEIGEFDKRFKNMGNWSGIEKGTLDYNKNTDSWVTHADGKTSEPMDVTTFTEANILMGKLDYGCVRLQLGNDTYVVSENGESEGVLDFV